MPPSLLSSPFPTSLPIKQFSSSLFLASLHLNIFFPLRCTDHSVSLLLFFSSANLHSFFSKPPSQYYLSSSPNVHRLSNPSPPSFTPPAYIPCEYNTLPSQALLFPSVLSASLSPSPWSSSLFPNSSLSLLTLHVFLLLSPNSPNH